MKFTMKPISVVHHACFLHCGHQQAMDILLKVIGAGMIIVLTKVLLLR